MDKFIFNRLKVYKGAILIIFVCSVMISVTDLMVPFLTSKFIDEILIARNVEEFYNFILMMFAIMTAAILSHYTSSILSKKILLSTAKQITEEILRHVQKLNGEFILNSDMIYLAKRIDNDATDFVTFVVESSIAFCFNFVILIMAIFLLFDLGVKWILTFFIVLILHIAAYKIFSDVLFNRSIAVRETNSKYFTSLTDNFVYAYSIKLQGFQEKYIAEFNTKFGKYFDAAINEMRIKFWFVNSDLNSGDLFRILVFLMGGLDVLNGEMTIGNLVALIGYYTLLMQSVAYFMSFGQGWQNARAAYLRLIEIKNIPPDIDGEIKLSGVNMIEICNIDYSIEGREILKNFSCKFERGKIYCIVGKNGAGKSTLMNLICGMIRLKSGQIFFDGLPLEKIDMIHARENFISFVEQKDFIRNDDLSGGERRKISIEKAFNKSADVLIMDEPDNNLDAAAISYITDKIISNKKNCITLIISHDERILKIADEIKSL